MQGLLEKASVVVCVGSGGVGKTTTAATLGLAAAERGRRVLVLTVDPAKRLANALGLDSLQSTPQQVDLPSGHVMHAMMLDLAHAWDDMLDRAAPDPQTRDALLQSRFYRHLSRDLPGAQEFIACEALFTHVQNGSWDLLILDTPPTANALDFLEAPARILDVIDLEAYALFERASGQEQGRGFLDAATGAGKAILGKVTGTEFLDELLEFLWMLRTIFSYIRDRTRGFQKILQEEADFVVVSAAQPHQLQEAQDFCELLQNRGYKIASVILNQIAMALPDHLRFLDPDVLQQEHGLGAEKADALMGIVQHHQQLRRQQQARLAKAFGNLAGGIVRREVPRLESDIRQMSDLAALKRFLLGDE